MVFPRHRSLVTALGCTAATIAFIFAVIALAPSLGRTLGATHGRGIGVNYTLDSFQCVGGTSQFRDCRWMGTVSTVEDGEMQTRVVYRDAAPEDSKVGTTFEALWSPLDPQSAYSLESSRAWLNTLASAIVSGLGAVLFFILSIYWWRRVASEARDTPPTSPPRPELTADEALEDA